MRNSKFSYTTESLQKTVEKILALAKEGHATSCDAEASEGFGQNVTVRNGAVETIEHNRDKGIGVTVYVGDKKGHASTSDFSDNAVRDTVAAALSIAKLTASDDCSGLAEKELLAKDVHDLDLYYPWEISVEEAIELAKECEAAAFATDPRISNSEGASVAVHESQFVYGNSLGFIGGYPLSRHAVSCAVIAGKGENMQRDDWWSDVRDSADIGSIALIGRTAGERCVRRLDARKIETVQVPVLYEAPVAASLLSHFVAAASGGSLYRKSSFLLDALGTKIFSSLVTIKEFPHLPKGLASCAFDDEGVATHDRTIVNAGVLQGYFLSSYSARKLGMKTTGNAGGNHNLIIETSGESYSELLRQMDRGFVVTELLGSGTNMVTGDYSRGAMGFWVERGEIQYPVHEVTVAGNLREMFQGIVGIGNDVLVRGSKQCGSILINRMTVAGD